MTSDRTSMGTFVQQKALNLLANFPSLRQGLQRYAKDFANALETPQERIRRLTYCDPLTLAATRALIDLNVFALLSEAEGPRSTSQLAKDTGADPKLLGRLLKHISVDNLVEETPTDQYGSTELTRALASSGGEAMVKTLLRLLPNLAATSRFLEETEYINPTDNTYTAWNHATGIKEQLFNYMMSPGQEEFAAAFNNTMGFKLSQVRWYDQRNIMNAVFGGTSSSKEDVLIVDVGGNTGRDMLGFRNAHGSIPGRVIVQDLLATIEGLDKQALAEQGVEAMAHDFFNPQPVEHAKCYFLGRILHDWPTAKCQEILSTLKPALKAGYSRVLLYEVVIPEQGARMLETGIDLLMMMTVAGQERRESEWRELVAGVEGLRVRKIWAVPGALEKIIEIERV